MEPTKATPEKTFPFLATGIGLILLAVLCSPVCLLLLWLINASGFGPDTDGFIRSGIVAIITGIAAVDLAVKALMIPIFITGAIMINRGLSNRQSRKIHETALIHPVRHE